MEVSHKVEEDSSDLPRVPDAHVNRKKNDSPSVSDISDDESSSESSDAPKLPPKPVKPRRSRTSMVASFGFDINDAVKVSSVFNALDEREAAEQERKRQEKEAKKLKREKLRQERERKQTEREEKSQREHEEQPNKSIEDTNDGSLPPIREPNENERPIKKHTNTAPNGEVRSKVIVLKSEAENTNGELPRKKRKYVRKPKQETEAKEGKEKKRRRKGSEEATPRKKRRKDSEENGEEKVTKKKRRRKESNGDDEKPKRRKKKNNNNNEAERSEEEPKKKRRKKKKEDDVSHDKSDSANSTKKRTRGRKPKRENSKKSEAENEKSESERATRGSKDSDESSDSGDEWTLIEEDLLPGDTLTLFSKQVFNEMIKKHAKTAAARALDRGYGFPMVPFKKLKPKFTPRKGLYECINQLAVNEQIATAAPLTKGRKEFRIPYGHDNDNGLSSSIEEDDKRLNGSSRKIQHPKKRLLSHLRSSSDGSKQSDLAQDEVDNFVKNNTAESM